MKTMICALTLLLTFPMAHAYDGEDYEESAVIENSQEEPYPTQLPAVQPTIDSENYPPPPVDDSDASARPAETEEGYYDDY